MSTPPPPFPPANQPPNSPPGGGQPGFGQPGPGQPGFGQPAFGQPGPAGGIGAPSWQTGGGGPLPSGLQPGATPPKSSKKGLVIGIIVLVAILVVVLVVVLGGDDDDSGGGIDAVGAHDGIEAVLRDGSYTDGSETVDDCPMGDLDDLSADVAKVLTIDDEVLEGEQDNTLFEEDSDFPGFASCQVATDENVDGAYGLYFQAILDPPRDYEGYVNDLYGDGTTLDFEDSEEYQGGEIFLFCGESMGEDGYTGCDADWVNTDEDVALNVFLYGDDVDTDDAAAALKAVLPAMATNLAQKADPDES